ncbi:nuclear pore complex protein Nup214 isoform X2 [Kryptolebias marmoratus]|uniref:nuclear pore complex protein Nup214 isoform X2 n=1 Tax=Kryptolebias marmoratus TaxID=37003 RepID=UPI0007F9225B|nr:nuclear pore complex protein Nup214 isoform X2 [Kryptolebias marmoratus]
MGDDTDSPPEREMKDFQFRQMKKVQVFEPADKMPKDRSSLLTISNKFGLTFVGLDRTFKVYFTQDVLAADKADGNSYEVVKGIAPLAEVTVELNLHHLALSCDELTLSVCGTSEEAGLSLTFYDVRTFMNRARPQKVPFASLQPAVGPGTSTQDLKWNPAHPSMLAACLSDGSMMILDVTDTVKVQAQLPAASGITCISWSPKGKQVAAGKMNATVSQYTPALEEKRVIPCPHFYTSDDPVKALDVLWLRTYAFAVAYAAADGCLETPPELVLISLPKKDEKVETKYLNFGDSVYGINTERQHHYFLSHIEDWDLLFAASAASIEVSVMARQDEKVWELWLLEDASRAELPVTATSEDTLPLGLAVDYTSQQEIHITDEKTLPPAPIMLMLSTEGLLCPFALLNQNPGVKQLVSPSTTLSLEGERLPKPGSLITQPTKLAASAPSAPASFPNLGFTSAAASSTPAPAASSSSAAPFSFVSSTPVSSSSSGFTFSVPATFSATSAPSAPSVFSVGGAAPFGSGPSIFPFASRPPSETPSSLSAFSLGTAAVKALPAAAPTATPQSLSTASPPNVKLNLNDRFSPVETPPPAFPFNSALPKTAVSISSSMSATSLPATKSQAGLAPVRPVQTSTPTNIVQKPAPAAQTRVQTPQATVSTKALEKQLQQKREIDPIMTGILEEIAHFQKELDDLKTRSAKADFKLGTNDEMKALRKESEDLHIFTLEIKETTESLHGDIGTLKTTLLEGFSSAEEAKTQSELSKDRNYRQLLYKKPLDPRSEEQLKEIRRLYQYVTFAVEDVNDVLDVEWEKHLEKKKKQKHMVVPGREGLFTTLSNNLYIINQQRSTLDQLVQDLTSLRLYSKTAAPSVKQNTATATTAGLETELEILKSALLKARLDDTPPKPKAKSPAVKLSPAKQSQLRNFLSKGQMPPVRSTAPANLSRSAFLSPKYYEDLDDASSTSSLSQSLEPHPPHLELEEEELQPLQLPPLSALAPSLTTPRHPTVVRTPSIQPGFGAIQSTPLTKIHPVPGVGFGLSPIASPVLTNKINLSGAESTALATKTVKHGAPPAERTVPVTISAQQAAATAALRRQMANQKTAVVSTSLTESTLKTVPQVVNVQELRDKEPPVPVSSIISSTLPELTTQAFATSPANQVKRIADSSASEDRVLTTGNTTASVQKMSSESTSIPQTGFVFGQPSKSDVSVVPVGSTEQSSSKPFSFTSGSSGFGFSSVTQGAGTSQVKDVNKFSFGGNGKALFGQTGEQPFSLTPKSTSSGLGSQSPTLVPNTSSEAAKNTPAVTAFRTDSQLPKTTGGETLGIFSGLRVGQGEEAKDSATKPASFTFGDASLGLGKGVQNFSFGPTDLSKGTAPNSLFKPPDSNAKPAFSVPPPTSAASALPTSFGSLLTPSLESSEEPKAPQQLSDPTPPPEEERPTTSEPAAESSSQSVAPEPAVEAATAATPAASTPALPSATTVSNPELPPAYTAAAEATPTSPATAPPTTEAPSDPAFAASVPTSAPATDAPVSQSPPAPFQVPTSEKPGSIFTQPAPVVTDSSSIGVTPVISTAAPAATTSTPAVADSTATTAASSVFGQPAAPPATSAPASTGFGSPGFGSSAGASFGKSVFGQINAFGQPASSSGTSAGFSFTQSAFGATSSSATTGGSSLFGSATPSNASSFSFGTSSANTASNTGTGLFGQNTAPAFGQSSGFGQGSVFGSNTTTSSSSGFSFGQSGFGCPPATSVFGQQSSSGGLFGQQQSSLFGSSSANTAASSTSGGFFSGLGGKPSEDAANKNPFGTTASPGAFGQAAQTGTTSLFGNSGAKAFGFGQSTFGEQKPSGTFTTGGGSVASQGFGSFSTPQKTAGGFGSPQVFGSPPSFSSSPAFGGAASFGSSPSFSNPMGSSTGKVFGEGTAASNMGGFGFASAPSAPSFGALANQSAPSFGSLAQQGTGFGSQPSSFSSFGQPQPQTGGFSGSTFGSANQSNPQTFSSWRS